MYPLVFHEKLSPDIHVDICLIEPTPERDYYTLVTLGMGAHRMNVPEELRNSRLDRAELLICLPARWNIRGQAEKWYWPLRWLKILARLPGSEDTWLGWGHTIPNSAEYAPYDETTELCGTLLGSLQEEISVFHAEDGTQINMYVMMPLYREEMEYKLEAGTEALLEKLFKLNGFGMVVFPDRPNVCIDAEETENTEDIEEENE